MTMENKICPICQWINELGSRQWMCGKCRTQYNKEYYKKNNEKLKTYRKEYYKTIDWKNTTRNYSRRRRALKKWVSVDNTVTQENLNILLDNQNNNCIYCKCDISNNSSRHLDHIYPLSKWWLHTISNLQWLCIQCNLRKSNRTHEEFLKLT